MQLHIFSLSRKGTSAYMTKQIPFCLKRGVLFSLKTSDFDWKSGVFYPNPRKGGVFQTWVLAWYTLWSGVGAGTSLDVNIENSYVYIRICIYDLILGSILIPSWVLDHSFIYLTFDVLRRCNYLSIPYMQCWFSYYVDKSGLKRLYVCEYSYTYLHTSERKAANNVNLALIMNEYSDAALVSLAPTFRLRWTVGTDYQQKQQQNNQTPALLTLCE